MTQFGVGEGRLGEVAKALFALDLLDIYAVWLTQIQYCFGNLNKNTHRGAL